MNAQVVGIDQPMKIAIKGIVVPALEVTGRPVKGGIPERGKALR
jgi:hypothetical protein